MLLVDDILLSPLRGVLWVFEKLATAVTSSQEDEEEALKGRLRELYMQVETGQIDEATFEAEEAGILDRLEELAESREQGDEEPAGASQDEEEEEGPS
jgi:hypothetical protein